jgi:hypothetical protein
MYQLAHPFIYSLFLWAKLNIVSNGDKLCEAIKDHILAIFKA